MTTRSRTLLSWNLLRYSYGAVLVLAGLDKILGTNLIVDWATYISAPVASLLPGVGIFLLGMGIVEVIVGIMLLTKFQKIAAYLSIVWLLLISANLVMLGMLDIAIRDVLLAVGAWVIALLTDVVAETRQAA